MMKKVTVCWIAMLSCVFAFADTETIISAGSEWKYLDNGTNQGTAWRNLSFNDGAWKKGNAELGYGNGDETTVVGYGSNSKKKFITTYFRKKINISDVSEFESFVLQLKRDDGAVIYINGKEAFRSNMPGGVIAYTTKATKASDDGKKVYSNSLPLSYFMKGMNIIAVEIHQSSETSTDIAFSLELLASKKKSSNSPPDAHASGDITISLPTNSVKLKGRGTDKDGTIIGYKWTKVSGPAAGTITKPGDAITTATGLVEGKYTFRLTVTDNDGASDPNDMIVIVKKGSNKTPTANAGTEQVIELPQNSIKLNGSGKDADGKIAGYKWSKVSGPSAYTIANKTSASTGVSGLVEGVYTFRLTVTDNNGAEGVSDVRITVKGKGKVPVSNAGADQAITLPTNSVTLNGAGSTEKNGAISSYLWTKVSGPTAGSITDPGNASTTVTGLVEGTYTFRLTVTDPNGKTDNDDMRVVVNAAPNAAPTANAGSDQALTLPTNSTTLEGSGTDGDGTITGYKWTKVSGPSATIKDANSATTNISGLTAGTYVFRLTVTDNDGATDTDDMTVVVNAASNAAPTASAGADQTITLPTSSVTLSGSGTDKDGTIVGYKWSKVSGPSAGSITDPSSAGTTVTGLAEGVYVFRLTVTDDDGATDTNDMQVTVKAAVANTAPTASAGADQTITLPTGSVTLSGSGTDKDGTIVGYKWSKVSGPTAGSITDPASAGTTVTGLVEGVYVFRLTVTDDDGATDTNDMQVTVKAASNSAPTANAGVDQTITLPTNAVTLKGSGTDDGTITTYKWTKVSGSSATITDAASASTSVTGLVEGTYVFRLTVTDNDGATDTDDMQVTVNAATTGGGSVTLTRGPYLQMANGSAVTIRWRTDQASNSKISVGTTYGTYTLSATDNTSTTEHEVRITGLSADKKYYYSFGSSSQTLQAGSDNFFTTAPPKSSTRKIRVAAFGDCGRNSNGFQSGSLSSYQDYVGDNPAELMLLLGDNAYDAGTDAEYTSKFFGIYSSNILKNHVLFPAPGNHDYANTSSRQKDHNIPYYSNFTMPANAECGGVASGTEAFYSYNWGNIHFLSLDSYGYEAGDTRLYDTTGPQVTWIKKDLEANSSKWTIAYWHHPPFTMGSHNSDQESELVKIRQNFIRILERYGVDMVLCGHSHDYERSYLLKGYYGTESSFNVANNAVTSSSGMYDGSSNSCAYNLESGKVNHGTVYVVSGSSGADGSVESGYPHNAMPFSVDDGGMFYFEVEDNRLDAKFIRRDGKIADKFTIVKDAGETNSITISSGASVTLTASWIGNYEWSNGATTRSITLSPGSSKTYTVSDGSNCLQDKFTVNVGSAVTKSSSSIVEAAPAQSETVEVASSFNAYPTPINRGQTLTITGDNKPATVTIYNNKGQKVTEFKMQKRYQLNTASMLQGVYYIRTEFNNKKVMKKIIVQ